MKTEYATLPIGAHSTVQHTQSVIAQLQAMLALHPTLPPMTGLRMIETKLAEEMKR